MPSIHKYLQCNKPSCQCNEKSRHLRSDNIKASAKAKKYECGDWIICDCSKCHKNEKEVSKFKSNIFKFYNGIEEEIEHIGK